MGNRHFLSCLGGRKDFEAYTSDSFGHLKQQACVDETHSITGASAICVETMDLLLLALWSIHLFELEFLQMHCPSGAAPVLQLADLQKCQDVMKMLLQLQRWPRMVHYATLLTDHWIQMIPCPGLPWRTQPPAVVVVTHLVVEVARHLEARQLDMVLEEALLVVRDCPSSSQVLMV